MAPLINMFTIAKYIIERVKNHVKTAVEKAATKHVRRTSDFFPPPNTPVSPPRPFRVLFDVSFSVLFIVFSNVSLDVFANVSCSVFGAF